MDPELDKFKNFHEGTPEKRHYDFYHLPFEDWVAKYYANPDLTQWKLWQEDANNALTNRNLFIQQWKGRSQKFDFQEMESTFEELKKKKEFEDDIMLYISFLAGDGFFKTYHITIEQWYTMKNWASPGIEPNSKTRTINELKLMPYGINYLRTRLADLNWWRT